MKRASLLVIAALAIAATFVSCGESKPYRMIDGRIYLNEPKRPAGQQDMLLFAAEPIDVVRVGFIGLGARGAAAPKRWAQIENTDIVAICDLDQAAIDKVQGYLKDAGRHPADEYTGSEDAWKAICERDDIDVVYVSTPWMTHVEMSVYAMERGKHVAVEMPAAMTIDELWTLVDTSERTRRHCFMTENCVYDYYEMTVLNMAQQGLFGEVLQASGGYSHCLDHLLRQPDPRWRVERMRIFRGDPYPTHGLGPVCQLLNIHRGDRLDFLVSVDTEAVVGRELYADATGERPEVFKNGDQTSTFIRTANGKVITLFHNVVTPRPYNRGYSVVGTKGYVEKYPTENMMIGSHVEEGVNPNTLGAHKFMSDKEREALLKQYRHPILIETEEMAKKVGGHGGMDYILDYRLVYCLRHGLPLDMDVYDMAEWSCVVALSGISLENGSVPVAVPDFTRGAWNKVQGYRHAMKE